VEDGSAARSSERLEMEAASPHPMKQAASASKQQHRHLHLLPGAASSPTLPRGASLLHGFSRQGSRLTGSGLDETDDEDEMFAGAGLTAMQRLQAKAHEQQQREQQQQQPVRSPVVAFASGTTADTTGAMQEQPSKAKAPPPPAVLPNAVPDASSAPQKNGEDMQQVWQEEGDATNPHQDGSGQQEGEDNDKDKDNKDDDEEDNKKKRAETNARWRQLMAILVSSTTLSLILLGLLLLFGVTARDFMTAVAPEVNNMNRMHAAATVGHRQAQDVVLCNNSVPSCGWFFNISDTRWENRGRGRGPESSFNSFSFSPHLFLTLLSCT
jgi:hypothetical protein